jgi:hypothetical protein
LSIASYKGTFAANTGTGDQSVTGVGFQPLAVIFWHTRQSAEGYAANAYGGFGASVSSSQRKAVGYFEDDNLPTSNTGRSQHDKAIVGASAATPTMDYEADFVSMDADGFTINWSNAPGIAVIVHFLALGGSSLTNAAVGEFTANTGTGNQAVAGAGFQPDFLMLFTADNETALNSNRSQASFSLGFGTSSSARVSMGWASNDASSAQVSIVYSSAAAILNPMSTAGSLDSEADLVTLDADGFTINWTNAPAVAAKCFYLALKGGSYKVGSETQKTSGGTKATTGVGFQPTSILMMGQGRTVGTFSTTTDSVITIGAGDGTRQGVAWWGGDDASDNTDTNMRTITTGAMMSATHPSTTVTEADIASLDADGFTLDWTTADANARLIYYAAFGPAAAASADPVFPIMAQLGAR